MRRLPMFTLVSVGVIWVFVSVSSCQLPPPTPTPQISTYASPTSRPTWTPKPTLRPTSTRTPMRPTRTPTPQTLTHVVHKGETLSGIAKKYGVTVDELVAWNDIKNPDVIHVGQSLVVKPSTKDKGHPTNASNSIAAPTSWYSETTYVTKVIDGDTIEASVGGRSYRVRYIGIDTPEQGEPFCYEATEYNRKMVGGKAIRLEKDVSETDKYGRLLRYVYYQDGDKWYQVNGSLVYAGVAVVSTYPPDVKYQDKFLQWQRDARANGRGIWGSPPFPHTAPGNDQPSQPAPCDCGGNYYNCDNFPTQATAQACFGYCWSVVGYDVHRLDRDGDGIACEWNP